jgi:putative transposase
MTLLRDLPIIFLSSEEALRDLAWENLALRQQLAVATRSHQRPRLRSRGRLFWVMLSRLWKGWRSALVIVKPDTVVRWHRAGFRVFWSWISRRRDCQGRPAVDAEVRDIIRRMAVDNNWGAPRIHGELRMLGFDVSERTVSRYLRKLHRRPEARQSWMTFLHNHRELIAAMDLFVVFTATFRLLYVLLVIQHGRRQIVHFNVTEHPTAAWATQQMREAFPFDSAPKYLIFDRDSIFSAEVVHVVKGMGIAPTRTSYSAPWQNGLLERWIGCARQEMLDHVIVKDAPHLRRLLREYVAYHHHDRTHCGLGKQTPMRWGEQPKPSPCAKVVVLPRVGGLHHRYEWRDAV